MAFEDDLLNSLKVSLDLGSRNHAFFGIMGTTVGMPIRMVDFNQIKFIGRYRVVPGPTE